MVQWLNQLINHVHHWHWLFSSFTIKFFQSIEDIHKSAKNITLILSIYNKLGLLYGGSQTTMNYGGRYKKIGLTIQKAPLSISTLYAIFLQSRYFRIIQRTHNQRTLLVQLSWTANTNWVPTRLPTETFSVQLPHVTFFLNFSILQTTSTLSIDVNWRILARSLSRQNSSAEKTNFWDNFGSFKRSNIRTISEQ